MGQQHRCLHPIQHLLQQQPTIQYVSNNDIDYLLVQGLNVFNSTWVQLSSLLQYQATQLCSSYGLPSARRPSSAGDAWKGMTGAGPSPCCLAFVSSPPPKAQCMCPALLLPHKHTPQPQLWLTVLTSPALLRFEWSQKMPSLVHSTTMTCVGLVIVLRRDWQSPTIVTDKDELVSVLQA